MLSHKATGLGIVIPNSMQVIESLVQDVMQRGRELSSLNLREADAEKPFPQIIGGQQ